MKRSYLILLSTLSICLNLNSQTINKGIQNGAQQSYIGIIMGYTSTTRLIGTGFLFGATHERVIKHGKLSGEVGLYYQEKGDRN